MTDDLGRRQNDVDPAVKLYVQGELADTRHKLIGQIGEIGLKVDLAKMTATEEHGQVTAKLDQLTRDVALLQPLAGEVAALKMSDALAETAASTARRMQEQSKAQFYKLATLIVAVAGVIVAFGH